MPSGNFGNILAGHVAREMGLPIARLIAGHQRERRARRVLPHRPLSAARRTRGDPCDVLAVDGHLARRRTSSASCSTSSVAIRGAWRALWQTLGRDGGFDLAGTPWWPRCVASRRSCRAAARMPIGSPRSATSTRATASSSTRTPPTASRSARERARSRRSRWSASRPRCRRSSPRRSARRSGASPERPPAFEGLESRQAALRGAAGGRRARQGVHRRHARRLTATGRPMRLR